MQIIARSPTRISLFGGGTDVEPFASEYGGKVLNMAINIRHECALYPRGFFCQTSISAMDCLRKYWRTPDPAKDKKFSLMYRIMGSYQDFGGFDLVDRFDGIQSAGLGSSASAAVCLIGAMNRWHGIEQSREQIADNAWQAEIDLGWVSGKQDQYASAMGGVNFFEFNGKVWNEPIPKGIADDFVHFCLLVYTGRKRHSANLQNKLKQRMETSDEAIKALKKMRTLAWEGRDALKSGDYERVGWLLDQSWQEKKISNPAVTNPRIDRFVCQAMESGAWGCKILGAGGEGHALIVADPVAHEQILAATGLQKIDFSIDYNGLEVRTC